MKIAVFALLTVCLLGSCVVSQRKHDEVIAEKLRLEAELAELEEKIADLEASKAELEQELVEADNRNKNLDEQLGDLESQLAMQRENYDKLDQQYNNMLANSSQLNQDLAEQRARVRELEKMIEDKEAAVRRLKNSVSDALLNFTDDELTVEVKNGKVYVSLAEKLLFGSGSIEVDPKGKQALQQLGNVLKSNPDINIMIEGHTDNVRISNTSKYMKDNWDLSVMRATAITRIMTDAGVPPEKISAAGRGEFLPVGTNDTADGRKLNRRSEIILTPNLDELFQLLE